MLKGHTKLELIDVNTGEKEIREYDNMLTNAVPNFLVNNWAFGNLTLNEAGNVARMVANNNIPSPILDKFGGLYLFQNELTENANAYDFPTDNTLIGCAGMNTTSNNECQQIGSYNSIESSIDYEDKTVSLVFDFTTSQANGQISAVSLTHSEAGACPIQGVVSTPNENLVRSQPANTVNMANTIKTVVGMQSYHGSRNYILPNGNIMAKRASITGNAISDLLLAGDTLRCAGYTDDYIIFFNLIDTSTLQIFYVYEEMAKASIMNKHNGDYVTVAKIETVELPVAITQAYIGCFGICDDVLAFYSWNNDSSYELHIHMVNLGTLDAAHKQIVLPNYYQASLFNNDVNSIHTLFANGKVLVCPPYSTIPERVSYGMVVPPLVIDVQTGVVTKVTFPFFQNYRELYPTAQLRNCRCSFNGIFSKDWVALAVDGAVDYSMFALNLQTMTAYPVLGKTGGTMTGIYAHGDPTKNSSQYGRLVAHSTYYTEIITACEQSSHYLATINNLTSPVVKTADKTMKVTYTLQEV